MYLQQFFVEGLGHASYLMGADTTHEAVVVDPRRDIDGYLTAASEAGLRIRYVLETHVHNDFLSGAKALAERVGAEHVAPVAGDLLFPHRPVREGDRIRLGELTIAVLETPGHTPEHVVYVVTDTARADEPVLVFSGGDLLVGAVGRPDLLGRELGEELAPKLYESLFSEILTLADYVEVLPTHGAGSSCGKGISTKRTSTIGYERRFNPALQYRDRHAFVENVLAGQPFIPAYYARMRPANRQGPPAFTAPAPRPLTVAEVQQAVAGGAAILDTRSPEAFSASHIPGSYAVALGAAMSNWAGTVLPADAPIVLVLARPADWTEVVTILARIGYDQVLGYLLGGIEAWQEHGLPIAHVEPIDVRELDRRRRAGDVQIVDVRSAGEWGDGHIPGARLLPLYELAERLDELDRSKPTAVLCGSGYRSSVGASLLKRAGFPTVLHVVGGMTAWRAAGKETATDRSPQAAA